MQQACVYLGPKSVCVSLPAPDIEVLEGLEWGQIEAFPTPAYWCFQVLARRIYSNTIRNRLGASLQEEVAACLLGGHGISADVGMLAFEHLKAKGAFVGQPPEETTLQSWLSEPMNLGTKRIKYRFATQKARYLAAALRFLRDELVPLRSGRELRDWLLQIPGIGPKTASWVARNWLDSDEIAILDIHLLRAGVLTGFFDSKLSVEKNYLELETQFLDFCEAIDVRPSELDAVIWAEMRNSPSSVALGISALPDGDFKERYALKLRTNHSDSDARQLALLG